MIPSSSQNKQLISIGCVLYEGKVFIPSFLQCIAKQTFPHIEILIHDNTGGKYEDYFRKYHPHVIYKKSNNIGFSVAHNILIQACKGEFYLCANVHQVFPQDYVMQLFQAIDTNPLYATAIGKIYQWNIDKNIQKITQEDVQNTTTSTITNP